MINKIIVLCFVLGMFSCKQVNEGPDYEIVKGLKADDLKISLAQWSFNKALNSGEMDNLKFASKAASMGFAGIEYVNQFFKDKARDTAYLQQMNEMASLAGVKQLLIMIDSEGDLGELDELKRTEAIENHFKWVDAAVYLGCHSIRVNARGKGDKDSVAIAAIDGLSRLSEYAAQKGLNVIVENHGGISSNGEWLSKVIAGVNKPNCGTLPDFGNFCITTEKGKCIEEYDRYVGVEELMPFAKAVSAKSNDFGEMGFETKIDYLRMLQIVYKAGYRGYIGVEYEGKTMSEEDGVKATKLLIEKCFQKLVDTSNN